VPNVRCPLLSIDVERPSDVDGRKHANRKDERGDLEPLSRISQTTRCATCVARSDVAATDATKQTSSGNTISLRSMLGRVESGRTTPRKRGL
jgi:hypothetical protein